MSATLTASAWLLGVPACNTPFIPLPPPADPTFAPVMVSDGMGGMRTVWEARGAPAPAMAAAKVSVYNVTAGSGVIVRAENDGSYVAGTFEGREGDRVEIEYQASDRRKAPGICRVLQTGVARTECPQ
jgi:hypothetical protein